MKKTCSHWDSNRGNADRNTRRLSALNQDNASTKSGILSYQASELLSVTKSWLLRVVYALHSVQLLSINGNQQINVQFVKMILIY